jgi:VWFA-related protein
MWQWHAAVFLCFLASGGALTTPSSRAQQLIGSDEVRIASRTYVPEQRVLRVESKAVQVGVVVRDRQDRTVPDLTASDFELIDRGKKQTISKFLVIHAEPATVSPNTPSVKSTVPPPPAPAARARRFIALFFDDLNTEPGDFRRTQVAAERFVGESLTPDDRVAIFANSGAQSEDFSNDKPKLISEIEKLHGHPRVPERGLEQCARIGPYEAYLINNNLDPEGLAIAVQDEEQCGGGDAQALQEMVKAEAEETWGFVEQVSQNTLARLQGVIAALARMPGQRTLLVASSGFLTPTLQQAQDAIVTQALHASVIIDSLDAKGLAVEALGPGQSLYARQVSSNTRAMYEVRMMAERESAVTAAMEDLADSTGGSFFHNNNDLSLGFRRLAAAPEFAYLLSFSPDRSLMDGKYHSLKVKLITANHYRLQARPGYFAPTKEASAPTAAEKLDAEVRGSDEKSEIPSTVRDALGAMKSGEREITVQTHVDIAKLPFEKEKDRHDEKLTFVAGLFDPQGKFVTGKEAEMDLALKQDSFERFSKSGITGSMSLEAPPGTYRLRVVVQEAVHGAMSATSQNVQIQ